MQISSLRRDPASFDSYLARTADLPSLHAFTRGLELDMAAAIAAVTLPFHNGRTEALAGAGRQARPGTGQHPPARPPLLVIGTGQGGRSRG